MTLRDATYSQLAEALADHRERSARWHEKREAKRAEKLEAERAAIREHRAAMADFEAQKSRMADIERRLAEAGSPLV